MYTYTPTSKFLVLAPIQSAPLAAANEQTETNISSVPGVLLPASQRDSSSWVTTTLGLPVPAFEFERIDALHRGVSDRAGHDIVISEVFGGDVLIIKSNFLFLLDQYYTL
ncbi:hypothetical protein BDV10DRAFT_185849 [Aspergillus recurvatus]